MSAQSATEFAGTRADWLHQQTSEVQILLYACRVTNRAGCSDHLAALLKGPVNYKTLHALAKRHCLVESLNWLLGASWLSLPKELLQELRDYGSASARRNAELLRELIAITNAAATQSIPLLHIKGPTLALVAYHDPGIRHCGDLDIVTLAQYVPALLETLRKRGYRPTVVESFRKATWEDLARKELLELGSEIALKHPDTGILADIHWRLMKDSTLSISEERVWNSVVVLKDGAGEFNILSPPLNFLYLAMHAAKHGWCNLRWIADLACLMSNDLFDYDGLVQLGRQTGYNKLVLFSLHLASYCPGTELPEHIEQIIAKESKIIRKARAVIDRVVHGRGLPDLEARFLMISLQDNPLAIIRMVAAELFEPTVRDWEYAGLPVGRSPLMGQLRLVDRYLLKRRRRS